MKKRYLITTLAFMGLALISCNNNNDVNNSKDKIVSKDIYGMNKDDSSIIKLSNMNLLFKENSDIPYISLDEGTQFMDSLRKINLDDTTKYKYTSVKDGDNYIISNETGAKCTINATSQTLTYDDYDKFSNYTPEGQSPLSIVSIKKNTKAIKSTSQKYTKGNSLTVDLKPYSKLDIYKANDKFYIPLSVYNTLLCDTSENVSLTYNNKNLYMVIGDSLSTDMLGIPTTTALGDEIRKDVKMLSTTDEMALYNYESVCLDFDYQYGLKDDLFTSFDAWLTQKNYKNDILSTNIKTSDATLLTALTYLNDNHTALTEFSYHYEFGDNQIDKSKTNQLKDSLSTEYDNLEKERKELGIENGIEYKDDTVFVTFDKFTNIDNDLVYGMNTTDIDIKDDITGLDDIIGLDFENSMSDKLAQKDTTLLFNKLYKDLTSDTYKNTVKNIVIDLTTNEGGAADSLMYSLSTLIGNVNVILTNPKTLSRNEQSYKADINLDGKIDDNDKSLSELGFNIYILGSKHTFSSANAFSVIAKENNNKVVLLGEKTGGGPCAVRTTITPLGSSISSSGLSTISKLSNGKYVNINDGATPDVSLTKDKYLDRQYIKENIKNWSIK